MNDRVEVCLADELPPGDRKIIDVNGVSIGVFNVDGEYFAIQNQCPHQLAPLCKGVITGEINSSTVGEYEMTRKGEIIRCPWHGWQFDIKTGESVLNPHIRKRTMTFEATTESLKDEEVKYGTKLAGDEPPLQTYDVEVEQEVVVVFV